MSHSPDTVRRILTSALYAHRGLHADGRPENSLAAFEAAVRRGFGAELDVHLTADGRLAVFHDQRLLRMTGDDRRVCELTARELRCLRLKDSDEPIPFLEEVLPLFENRQPLIIELKTDGDNHAALCKAVCELLDGYKGVFCIESFDPRCLMWLRKHRPHIVRGQLSQNFRKTKDVAPLLRSLLTSLCLNIATKPDFISYRFEHRRDLSFRLCRRIRRPFTVYWTLTSQNDLDTALQDGAVPIFEGFLPKI